MKVKHEWWGYNPPYYASCVCGWVQRFESIITAQAGSAVHVAAGCEGSDHVICYEEVYP
jgi:hypothetical protein